MSALNFTAAHIREIKQDAQFAFLQNIPETDCPYFAAHEREIWLTEYRRAQFEMTCA